jgi:hypothetical protein
MKRKEILSEILARLISIDKRLGELMPPVVDESEPLLLNEDCPTEEGDIEDIPDSTWSR